MTFGYRDIAISENYFINFTKVNESTVLVQNKGDLSEFKSDRYGELILEFLKNASIKKPYIEIRSFAGLKGTTSKSEMKKHLAFLEEHKENYLAIYFCETPFWLAPLSQMGYRNLKKFFVFEIMGSIEEAVTKAAALLASDGKKEIGTIRNKKNIYRISEDELRLAVDYATRILWDELDDRLSLWQPDGDNPLKPFKDILDVIYKDLLELRTEDERRSSHIFDILKFIDIGLILIEPEERTILFANQSASVLCGVPAEELAGRECLGIFCSSNGSSCPRGNGLFTLNREEETLERRDGTKITVLKTARPVKIQGREILVETIMDISPIKTVEREKTRALANLKEHKKMLLSIMEDTQLSYKESRELNKQIRASEELLKLSVSVAHMGIWVLDLEKGRIDFSNEFFAITGYGEEGFPRSARAFRDRVHPEDLADTNKLILTLLSGSYRSEEYPEFRFRRKDGQYIWLQARSRMIGEKRLIGILSDITEKKLKESRIEKLNALQSALLEQIALSEKFSRITMTVYEVLQCEIAAIWLYEPGEIRCPEGCLFSNGKRRYNRCGNRYTCLKLAAFSSSMLYSSEKLMNIGAMEFRIDEVLLRGEKKSRNVIEPGHDLLENDRILNHLVYVLMDGEMNSIGIMSLFSRGLPDQEEDFYLETIAKLTSQVIQNDKTTEILQSALEQAERANNIMEGREVRIREMKGEVNRLLRESGGKDKYRETIDSHEQGMHRPGRISPEESRRNALSLVEDAEIARRETQNINDQLTLIKHAVNNSSDAIAISTLTGDFFYINSTFTSLFGFTIERLAMLPTDLLFDEPDIVDAVLETVDSGSIWQGRVHVFKENNDVLPVLLRTSPFRDEKGTIIGLLWSMTDIREQLENERRIEKDLAEKKQMLNKATLLQKSFIQKTLPILEKLTVKALFLPCETLGGDFFRIISNRYEKKLMIVIGDCTDHGLKASMDASLLSSLIDPHLDRLLNGETDIFLRDISRDFYRMADDDQFPTMTAMVIDETNGQIRYSNANGELPFLIRGNDVFQLEKASGMHIAYFEEPEYEMKTFQLESGDRLLFFSDALPEMKIDHNTRLGYDRLMEILKEENATNSRSFHALIDRMEAMSHRLPLEDDLTLISLQFQEPQVRESEYSGEEELNDFLKQIRKDLETMDFKDDEISRTDIVLRELYLNAFHHGNKGDKQRKIHVKSHIDCSGCRISLEDEGEGFDRSSLIDPIGNIESILRRDVEEEYTHGRGIVIAEQFTDSLEYNEKGNAVILKLSRKENRVTTYN